MGAIVALWLRNIYDPIHFTDEKIEEERDKVACSRSHRGVRLWPRPTLLVLKRSDMVYSDFSGTACSDKCCWVERING